MKISELRKIQIAEPGRSHLKVSGYALAFGAAAAVLCFGIFNSDLKRLTAEARKAEVTLQSKRVWARQNLMEIDKNLFKCRPPNSDVTLGIEFACVYVAQAARQGIDNQVTTVETAVITTVREKNAQERNKFGFTGLAGIIGFIVGLSRIRPSSNGPDQGREPDVERVYK